MRIKSSSEDIIGRNRKNESRKRSAFPEIVCLALLPLSDIKFPVTKKKKKTCRQRERER
jgi:hypothetical protein